MVSENDDMEADEELQKLNEEIAKLSSAEGGVLSPEPPIKDSILKFFREIINSKDSTKVSNLDKFELPYVRGLKHIANYADIRGLDKVRDYLNYDAEIYLSTAMSKLGFMAQLFVTQIKKEQKTQITPQVKKAWGGFGKKHDDTQQEGV